MIRRVIQIDESACNGCGACAAACHEGAIAMVGGKARLIRDDYCDGLGDCLPACPTGAITFVEREAVAYDEQAVLAAKAQAGAPAPRSAGCPGSAPRAFEREGGAPIPRVAGCPGSAPRVLAWDAEPSTPVVPAPVAPASVATAPVVPAPVAGASQQLRSELRQWPVQIKLVPVAAPWFDGADVLVAADCCAFAYAAFHQDFMRGRVTLVGCPKLDAVDYAEKLAQIFAAHDVRSVTVARMEVPCCGGLEQAVRRALQVSGSPAPLTVITVSTDGRVL